MSLDPRADALLAKYPDQLSEEEMAELRALAESDSLVEAMMDSIHEAEMLLKDGQANLEISEAGRELLDSIVTETLGENPDVVLTVEEIFAPVSASLTTGSEDETLGMAELGPGSGSAADEVANEPSSPQVRSLGGSRVGLAALAALLVLGIGLILFSRGTHSIPENLPLAPPSLDDDLVPRGVVDTPPEGTGAADDPDDTLPASGKSELLIHGPDASGEVDDARVSSGDQRSIERSITFTAHLGEPASLALVESVEGGRNWVVYPAPTASWDVGPGTNVLHPEGAEPAYSPSGAGRTSYRLLGSAPGALFETPASRELVDLDTFITANQARVLDTVVIEWQPAP